MTPTLKPLVATLGLLALFSGNLHAQAATTALTGWTVLGDVASNGTTLSLTTAFLDGGASGDAPANLSGESAVGIDLLEAAAGVPVYGLDLSDTQAGTEGSLASQSFTVLAGQTLSVDWSFATLETGMQSPVIEDRAFVVIDGVVTTLATYSAPGAGTQSFSRTFAQGGSVALAFGVIDTDDYLAVSALTIGNLQLAPVTAVPEPVTSVLLLAGLGVIGTVARRRHRSA